MGFCQQRASTAELASTSVVLPRAEVTLPISFSLPPLCCCAVDDPRAAPLCCSLLLSHNYLFHPTRPRRRPALIAPATARCTANAPAVDLSAAGLEAPSAARRSARLLHLPRCPAFSPWSRGLPAHSNASSVFGRPPAFPRQPPRTDQPPQWATNQSPRR